MSETALPASVHMLGICGTGMAALAGLLKSRGVRVTGSDAQAYPPMSDHLAAQGISYTLGYAPENVPDDVELAVVGNVIQASNPEAQAVMARGLPYLSMAEAVRRFAIGTGRSIVVAGTHGKTTTTALAAHLLMELGADPGFLVGGLANNFQGNFRVGGGGVFVIEGDEYDTAYFDKTPKFFKYAAHTVILTSIEYDHADIYPSLEALRAQFTALVESLPPDGLLIACADDPEVAALIPRAPCPVVAYGFGDHPDKGGAAGGSNPQAHIRAVEDDGAHTTFTLEDGGNTGQWRMALPGRHNVLNAAAVVALARRMGYPDEKIATALAAFRGVKRRQEIRGEARGVLVLDDFAHHPTAVARTIEAIQARYAGRRVWAVFEPRSFTARSDRFRAGFTEALARAERVLLAPPYQSGYSAGDAPLDTAAVADTINAGGGWARAAGGTDALLETLTAECQPGDVVLIMSNGGFDDIHNRLLAALREG